MTKKVGKIELEVHHSSRSVYVANRCGRVTSGIELCKEECFKFGNLQRIPESLIQWQLITLMIRNLYFLQVITLSNEAGY